MRIQVTRTKPLTFVVLILILIFYAIYANLPIIYYKILVPKEFQAIPPVYRFASSFSEGLAVVSNDDFSKYGYINTKGDMVIPFKYQDADDFHENLAKVVENNLVGFINNQGQYIVKSKYAYALAFHEGLAAVKLNGKWGYIDKTGKVIIDFQFSEAGSFSEGFAVIGQHYNHPGKTAIINSTPFDYMLKKMYINRQGKIALKNNYENIRDFHNGLAAIESKNKWGFIDITGKVVIPIKFYSVEDFSDGKALVNITDDAIVHINKKGDFIDRPISSFMNSVNKSVVFSEGLAIVTKLDQFGTVYASSKKGYINENYKLVINYIFDYASPFNEGLAAVTICGKTGFIKNPLIKLGKEENYK